MTGGSRPFRPSPATQAAPPRIGLRLLLDPEIFHALAKRATREQSSIGEQIEMMIERGLGI